MSLTDVLPQGPTTSADARALFDESDPVAGEFMIGTWRGDELPTGHPLDGMLAVSGWWRKQFVDAVIGAMDLRGSKRPYFFVLHRDESLPVI
ncbi:MAG: GXWXG domain-containing protein [Mycobacterium sp.]